jgi:phosphoglycolate phosphatase-like HAD superfamily hydrolase
LAESQALVLFDIDGTLVRGAGEHHRLALAEGIRRVTGITTSLDGVSTSGMLDRDLIVSMLEAAGQEASAIAQQLNQIMAECCTIYQSYGEDLRRFVCPGVVETLVELRDRGAVLGLVSGNLASIGWRKVELAGLREYFSIGGFADDGTTRARVARVARQRAQKEGLVSMNPKVSLVGDHHNDILAARANGFQSVAVATGLTPMEELSRSQPDLLVPDLRQLPLERLL